MSIAREIVAAHKGEIGVISQPGQGTRIQVRVARPIPA